MPALTLSLTLLTGAAARAQEKGRTGLTVAFPAAVGVIWHVTDRVALRPDVSFSWSSSSPDPASASSFTSSGNGASVGVGLSGLFYVRKWEGLSAYVSPRFSYARNSTTLTTTISTVTLVGPGGGLDSTLSSVETEGTSSTYSLSGAFGAQYSLSRKFGVFGEAGFGYSHSRTSTTSSPSLPSLSSSSGVTVNAIGTRAGVGVIFYF
jgi:hypothetical protein